MASSPGKVWLTNFSWKSIAFPQLGLGAIVDSPLHKNKNKMWFFTFYFFYLFMFTCSFILLLLPLQSALWIWMSAFDGEQSKLPIGSSANWRKSNKLSAGEISNNPKIRKTDKTSLFASSIASDIAYNIVDPQGNRLEPQISRLLKMIPYNHKWGCWFGCRAKGKTFEFPKNSTKP